MSALISEEINTWNNLCVNKNEKPNEYFEIANDSTIPTEIEAVAPDVKFPANPGSFYMKRTANQLDLIFNNIKFSTYLYERLRSNSKIIEE